MPVSPTGLVITPIELVEPCGVVGGAGIDRRSRPTLSELLELRLEVGLEPGAVLAFEGAQLLEPTLENRPLLVDRAHDLGVLALGVGLQCVGLLLGLTQLGLGAGLRVGQQGVGALTGLGDRGLGFPTSVADDLSALARASDNSLSDSAWAVPVSRSAVSWARASTRAALMACSSPSGERTAGAGAAAATGCGDGLTGSGSGSYTGMDWVG